MNLVVKQSELLRALKTLNRVIRPIGIMPILTCVVLKVRGEVLTLAGQDLDMGTIIELPLVGGEDGTVAVPIKRLIEIVERLPKVMLTLSTETGDHALVITTKTSRYRLTTISAEEMPPFPRAQEERRTFRIMESLFYRMLHQTLPSTSLDGLRPALTGIHLWIEANSRLAIGVQSCDLHRLSTRILPQSIDVEGVETACYEMEEGTKGHYIIPAKAAQELLKLLSENATSHVLCFGSTSALLVVTSRFQFYTRLIAEKYPEFWTCRPEMFTQSWVVEKDLLLAACKRVEVIARNNAQRLVLMPTAEGVLALSSSAEEGSAEERISFRAEGEAEPIIVNAQYLKEAVSEMEGDTIHFQIAGRECPVLLYGDQDPQYEVILMPRTA